MAEWKHLITEWLSEYAALRENEIKSFAAEHEHNHEIATAIFNLLYGEADNENETIQKSEESDEQVWVLFNDSIIFLLLFSLL